MLFSRVTTRYVPHGTIWFDEAQMDSKDLPRSMWYQIMRLCLGHFATQNMKQRSCEQIPLMTTAIWPMWELSGLLAGARPWQFCFKDMNEAKKRNTYFCQVFFPFLHTMLLYKSFLLYMLCTLCYATRDGWCLKELNPCLTCAKSRFLWVFGKKGAANLEFTKLTCNPTDELKVKKLPWLVHWSVLSPT